MNMWIERFKLVVDTTRKTWLTSYWYPSGIACAMKSQISRQKCRRGYENSTAVIRIPYAPEIQPHDSGTNTDTQRQIYTRTIGETNNISTSKWMHVPIHACTHPTANTRTNKHAQICNMSVEYTNKCTVKGSTTITTTDKFTHHGRPESQPLLRITDDWKPKAGPTRFQPRPDPTQISNATPNLALAQPCRIKPSRGFDPLSKLPPRLQSKQWSFFVEPKQTSKMILVAHMT